MRLPVAQTGGQADIIAAVQWPKPGGKHIGAGLIRQDVQRQHPVNVQRQPHRGAAVFRGDDPARQPFRRENIDISSKGTTPYRPGDR